MVDEIFTRATDGAILATPVDSKDEVATLKSMTVIDHVNPADSNELIAPALEQAAVIPAALILIPLMLVVSIVMNGSYVIRGLFDRPQQQ